MSDSEGIPKIVVASAPRKSAAELAEAYARDKRGRQRTKGLTVFGLGLLGLLVFVVATVLAVSNNRIPGIGLIVLGVGSLVAMFKGLAQAATAGNQPKPTNPGRNK